LVAYGDRFRFVCVRRVSPYAILLVAVRDV
jgi:hypothetical protein